MTEKEVVKRYQLVAGIVSATGILAGATLWAMGLLAVKVTLPVWALLLGGFGPLLMFLGAKVAYHRARRRFKLGDRVMIAGYDTEYIAIRYLFWFPAHVVCKEADSNDAIAINQKYLLPFRKTDKTPGRIINSIINPRRVKKAVPTITISRL